MVRWFDVRVRRSTTHARSACSRALLRLRTRTFCGAGSLSRTCVLVRFAHFARALCTAHFSFCFTHAHTTPHLFTFAYTRDFTTHTHTHVPHARSHAHWLALFAALCALFLFALCTFCTFRFCTHFWLPFTCTALDLLCIFALLCTHKHFFTALHFTPFALHRTFLLFPRSVPHTFHVLHRLHSFGYTYHRTHTTTCTYTFTPPPLLWFVLYGSSFGVRRSMVLWFVRSFGVLPAPRVFTFTFAARFVLRTRARTHARFHPRTRFWFARFTHYLYLYTGSFTARVFAHVHFCFSRFSGCARAHFAFTFAGCARFALPHFALFTHVTHAHFSHLYGYTFAAFCRMVAVHVLPFAHAHVLRLHVCRVTHFHRTRAFVRFCVSRTFAFAFAFLVHLPLPFARWFAHVLVLHAHGFQFIFPIRAGSRAGSRTFVHVLRGAHDAHVILVARCAHARTTRAFRFSRSFTALHRVLPRSRTFAHARTRLCRTPHARARSFRTCAFCAFLRLHALAARALFTRTHTFCSHTFTAFRVFVHTFHTFCLYPHAHVSFHAHFYTFPTYTRSPHLCHVYLLFTFPALTPHTFLFRILHLPAHTTYTTTRSGSRFGSPTPYPFDPACPRFPLLPHPFTFPWFPAYRHAFTFYLRFPFYLYPRLPLRPHTFARLPFAFTFTLRHVPTPLLPVHVFAFSRFALFAFYLCVLHTHFTFGLPIYLYRTFTARSRFTRSRFGSRFRFSCALFTRFTAHAHVYLYTFTHRTRTRSRSAFRARLRAPHTFSGSFSRHAHVPTRSPHLHVQVTLPLPRSHTVPTGTVSRSRVHVHVHVRLFAVRLRLAGSGSFLDGSFYERSAIYSCYGAIVRHRSTLCLYRLSF